MSYLVVIWTAFLVLFFNFPPIGASECYGFWYEYQWHFFKFFISYVTESFSYSVLSGFWYGSTVSLITSSLGFGLATLGVTPVVCLYMYVLRLRPLVLNLSHASWDTSLCSFSCSITCTFRLGPLLLFIYGMHVNWDWDLHYVIHHLYRETQTPVISAITCILRLRPNYLSYHTYLEALPILLDLSHDCVLSLGFLLLDLSHVTWDSSLC